MVNIKRQSVSLFSKNYKQVRDLYRTVFPIEERLPFIFLMLNSYRTIASAYAYYQEEKFIGFAYIIHNKDYLFVTYLGVNPEHHSQGFGSQMLADLKKLADGRHMILSIEPLDTKADNYHQRLKRLAFYERNGFTLTQVFYQENQEMFQFMVTDPSLNWKAFEKFLKQSFLGLASITFLEKNLN
ncbi:GNAT family N-acetyltransferase [Streptococcus pluranimalium]|uniref:GNAT family N-acetyltransferase n=1 Tax=Streptococcus pluranimalium TaxID=82348 RepID=UPI002AAE4353|nr:GNAT family N-acetyltransferase [Streptococcus suis]